MTELLYLQDSYLQESDSIVTSVSEHDGQILVELDKTPFYPMGGGQPSDSGRVVGEQGSVFNVTSVYKFQGKVMHVIDKQGLQVGDKVLAVVDWKDRFTNMCFHTAIHVVTRLIEEDKNIQVSSNNATLEKARIDFTLENFDREYLASFEAKANEVLKKDLKVKTYFLTKEEASKTPELFRLLKGFDESIQNIRIVEIEGYDKTACAGSHVKSLGEIPKIKFLKFENKGAKRRRIVFGFV